MENFSPIVSFLPSSLSICVNTIRPHSELCMSIFFQLILVFSVISPLVTNTRIHNREFTFVAYFGIVSLLHPHTQFSFALGAAYLSTEV